MDSDTLKLKHADKDALRYYLYKGPALPATTKHCVAFNTTMKLLHKLHLTTATSKH